MDFLKFPIGKTDFQDKNYPPLLKKIPDPPKILYFRGTLNVPKEKCFAIVGTRRCSAYGKEVALNMAADLSRAGLTIVSGLAPGIDTAAHLAIVERNQRTIAVLGTGLDEKSIYPKSNLQLSRKIVETGGCLISEYPSGTPGTKFTFPRRNRIISGLSLGVLVVEAKLKSGALITANFARKQKRLVFAVPGPLQSLNSQGPHLLIKSGAKLVETAQDVLTGLGFNKTKSLFEETEGQGDDETKLVLQALKEGPLEINEIIQKTRITASIVMASLTILEIEGRVRNLGQNTYSLIKR